MRALLGILFVLLGPVCVAQEAPVVACRFCGSHGEKDCTKHGAKFRELEAGAEQCSEIATCPKCRGATTIDCRICTNPASDAASEQRREAAAAWLAARRKEVDAHVSGKGLLHAKSAHVDLAFSIRPLTVGPGQARHAPLDAPLPGPTRRAAVSRDGGLGTHGRRLLGTSADLHVRELRRPPALGAAGGRRWRPQSGHEAHGRRRDLHHVSRSADHAG